MFSLSSLDPSSVSSAKSSSATSDSVSDGTDVIKSHVLCVEHVFDGANVSQENVSKEIILLSALTLKPRL